MTFTQWKRRVVVGTRLVCIENTYRPEVGGTVRTVNKVQTNAIRCTVNDEEKYWTYFPKSADARIVDDDTVRWLLFPGDTREDLRLHTVTLRIMPSEVHL